MGTARRFAATLFLIALICMSAAPAGAAPDDAAISFSHVNEARTSNRIAHLRWSDDLARIARAHSEDMARDGTIYHSTDLGSKVHDDWRVLGENVGEGPDMNSIDEAFMESPPHRKNILWHFKLVGIGTVRAPDGTVYVTQVFELPAPAGHRPSNHVFHPRTHVAHVAVRLKPAPRAIERDPMTASGTFAFLRLLASQY